MKYAINDLSAKASLANAKLSAARRSQKSMSMKYAINDLSVRANLANAKLSAACRSQKIIDRV